jgi:phosphatidate cytidylyltransferase
MAVASGRPGPEILRNAAAALFPIVYIGLPLGALAAVRVLGGREAVLLMMATIVISDSAQYYTGRALGRRPLAPTISPKKTVEGAVGGLVFGTLAFVVGARFVFGTAPALLVTLVGASIAALGIVGDLFESLLKRSAGVKDSGALIPGHGGVLDRIDSWLFAAPVYYVFVRYLSS